MQKYGCSFCDSKFKRKNHLDLHIVAKHTSEIAFKCEECPARFPSEGKLNAHGLVHTDERPHRCQTCDKAFKTRSSLMRHKNAVHSTSMVRRRFQCSICPKTYLTKRSLTKHGWTHNPSGARFGCYFCRKRFYDQSVLVNHTRIHTLEKPYFCPVESCQFSSSHPKSLSSHKNTHRQPTEKQQLKPKTCYFCSKTITSFQGLADHLRSHTLESPFTCGLCQKRFKNYKNLRNHISSHTKEKPFKCMECLKCFFDHSSLNVHTRAVHRKERRFFCEFCDYSAFRKNHLHTHIRRHNPTVT